MPSTPTLPWQTKGHPAGLIRMTDGTVNAFPVTWHLVDHRPGMGGVNTVTRRFPNADEALAAVEAGMAHAFKVEAHGLDADGKLALIGKRSNPNHRRNRRPVRAASQVAL